MPSLARSDKFLIPTGEFALNVLPVKKALGSTMTRLEASAILFDMDGTLVDSGGAVAGMWAEFARLYDLDLQEILSTSHGVRMSETLRRHAPAGTDFVGLESELTTVEMGLSTLSRPIPGAVELLDELHSRAIALVTSADRRLAEARMAAAGIAMPLVVVTASDVQHGKPHPEAYLRGAALLGCAPKDCVVFEDAEAGILAGLAAGMEVVVVGEHESATTRGLVRVPNFRELRVVIEQEAIILEFT